MELACLDLEGVLIPEADPKRKAVQAFHGLNFRIIATGGSYNDTTMPSEADAGILLRPPRT